MLEEEFDIEIDAELVIVENFETKEAIIKFVTWLNDYAKRQNFNILCERLTGNDITIQKLKKI